MNRNSQACCVLIMLCVSTMSCSQVVEDFETVLGLFPADLGGPVEGWSGVLQSQDFGPTGIFPGLDNSCGFFDAQAGSPGSYIAMNFNNARLGEFDTTSTWLISPEISIADQTAISFYTRTVIASPFPDRLVVRLSTNGDSIDVGKGPLKVGDFQNVLFDINPNHELGGYPEQWTKFETELNGFGASSGRIAFHYFNEFMNVNGNYIGIDTFRAIPFLIGDVNCDGVVDLLDVAPFVEAITSSYQIKADINQDGTVNLLDVDPFVDLLVGK